MILVGEQQVKYSGASESFSQTPCGYLVGFPDLFLIWFTPQSQRVLLFVLWVGMLVRRYYQVHILAERFSSLNFPGCEEEILQITSLFWGLCCCCRLSGRSTSGKLSTWRRFKHRQLQISAWAQQMTQEIAFSSQGLVFACSALWHTRRIGNPGSVTTFLNLTC